MGRFILLFILLFLISGCSHLPVTGPQAALLTARQLGTLDQQQLFAADPSGATVALSDGGLVLVAVADGSRQPLCADTPRALGWSPDGQGLAAAFSAGGETVLRVYDRQGRMQAEARVPGAVSALLWTPAQEVLAAAVQLEHFSFGTLLREWLHHWQPGKQPVPQTLHETTLKPSTLRQLGESRIRRSMQVRLAPLGDEIVYLKLHDPPALAPYSKVILRNLEQNAEQEVAIQDSGDGGIAFSADGEEILIGDAEGRIHAYPAWNGSSGRLLPLYGQHPLPSPDGRHLLSDGRLYLDSLEVARLPAGTGSFLQDGRLLFGWEGRLYLLALPDGALASSPPDTERAERLRKLRGWRAAGLITTREYAAARERILKR